MRGEVIFYSKIGVLPLCHGIPTFLSRSIEATSQASLYSGNEIYDNGIFNFISVVFLGFRSLMHEL